MTSTSPVPLVVDDTPRERAAAGEIQRRATRLRDWWREYLAQNGRKERKGRPRDGQVRIAKQERLEALRTRETWENPGVEDLKAWAVEFDVSPVTLAQDLESMRRSGPLARPLPDAPEFEEDKLAAYRATGPVERRRVFMYLRARFPDLTREQWADVFGCDLSGVDYMRRCLKLGADRVIGEALTEEVFQPFIDLYNVGVIDAGDLPIDSPQRVAHRRLALEAHAGKLDAMFKTGALEQVPAKSRVGVMVDGVGGEEGKPWWDRVAEVRDEMLAEVDEGDNGNVVADGVGGIVSVVETGGAVQGAAGMLVAMGAGDEEEDED
jgi:hypothetical protein